MDDEERILTPEEAESMISTDEEIHTFRNPAGVLIGADWKRSALIDLFKKFPPQLSGRAATAMKHGIALIDDTGNPLFIETVAELKE